MKLFLQFFWMGISKLLLYIFCIIGVIAGVAIPVLLAITVGSILMKIMHIAFAIILAIAFAVMCYCIIYIIYHSIKAVSYCKKTGTDSLKTAWEKTAIDWDSF